MADEPMDEQSNAGDAASRVSRSRVDDLERRSRAVSSSMLRHDVANAVGAARNALLLLSENPEPEAAARFLEIAKRNIERAEQLLCDVDGGAAERPGSARDERNDLGGASERQHGDAFGL
jgi:hypothetical protein